MKVIRPIKSEEDYQQALSEIERLMDTDPEVSSAGFDRLELLTILVEDYEEKHYPIPAPDDPVEVILYYMDRNGLTRKDLEPYIGSRARVSDVLNRKRSLSLSMIRRLNVGLGIPADFLIAPLQPARQSDKSGARVFPGVT